ncbi:hypothetical protein DFH08DRAFT_888956 [Mycena albidolilacea]|uniref:G domain-containing protein n=1 Tax=Mycena albidolilacea TaxID=1033008 RepID=A0AAD6ZGM0_9AGAR|nr:hypothetical protein DFH08DRAFT_888956 [Mycena albidolilacea]
MSESMETHLRGLNFNEELKSTFDAIVETCPKFRILLIGRTGVGKSALINAVFGSGVAKEEHGIKAGVVQDINREFVLPNNPRLVFHDSQGFSHGDGKNFETVLKFIKDRSAKPKLEDRLHVIWLCIEIPMYGGSLLEIAEEKILQSEELQVPIVVVFTKFDNPVNKIKRSLPKSNTYRDAIARDRAKQRFYEEHVDSLATIAQSIPRVEVSVRSGFKETLDLLVDLTEKEVKGIISYIWASSQCPNADLKINASIQIGRQRYWKGLSTTLNLPGQSLTKWLNVVLRDIVSCWGFDDPHGLLVSNHFKKKITALQSDLVDDDGIPFPKTTLGATATVAGVISGLIPPAAPFALPIAAGLIFAAWVYKAYLTTPQVLRGLMGYIVDLTVVMQSIFWLTQARAQKIGGSNPTATVPLSARLVELALTAYATDNHSRTVHEKIRLFVKRKVALKPDLVLDHVVELIKTHRFQPSKSFEADAENVAEPDDEGGDWSVAWDKDIEQT